MVTPDYYTTKWTKPNHYGWEWLNKWEVYDMFCPHLESLGLGYNTESCITHELMDWAEDRHLILGHP